MKRPWLLFFVVVVGCGDRVLHEGVDQPFAIEHGQFIEGALPGLPPDQALESPRPTAATTESTLLRPRMAGIEFFGWATLDAVAVGAQIEGQGTGHWVVPTGPPDPAVQGEPVRTWRFTADLHDIVPGRHRLLVAAKNEQGKTGNQIATTVCIHRPVPDNGNACDPAKMPPELVISVSWDRPVDLDLIVSTPNGDLIASRTPSKGIAGDQKASRLATEKTPEGAGYLDADSNSGCHIDGHQIENIVFPSKPQPGSYLVYVNLHAACGEQSVRYTVSRHTRIAGAAQGTFSVVETDRASGTLVAVQQNGSTKIGTFVSELFVP